MATQIRKEQAVVDLVINGRAAEKSIKDIQKATFETEKLLRNMSQAANPAEYAKLRKELLLLKNVQNDYNMSLKVGETSWQKFKSNIGQIALGTVGGNAFTALGVAAAAVIPKAIQKVTDLADAISNVQKTTRLAKDDVEDLFNEFKDIDTRSTSAELRDLAAMAGKLGEDTKEGVRGFVEGADIINVALKEDLGGSAEEAINRVGKLISIFDLKRQFGIEDSFIKVGSVINELGGNSAASEEYIVNFTTRLAGIAPAAKISIAEVMGLAAVMDEQGQSTELAATNIGKMLISLGKDIPYFAKVAGMSVKEFTTLLNTNANEALLRVVERAKQSEGGLGNLAKTFKTLGIEGSEGAAVIGALANNLDRVRAQQAVANREFENGTSILNEYNIKNNNSAAIWEKVTRKVGGFISGAFKPLGEAIISISGRLFGVVTEFDKLSEKLQTQKDKVNGLEKSLVPLLNKYDSLVLQAAQGKDVHNELNKVVQQVADIMPTAVTGWDKYGNAIDINNAKARHAIEDHKAMMEYLNKESIDELEKKRLESAAAIANIKKELNTKTIKRSYGINAYGQEITAEVEKTDKDLEKLRKDLNSLNEKHVKINRTINQLAGFDKYYTGKPKGEAPNRPTLPAAIGGTFEGDGASKKDKPANSAAEKAAREEADRIERLTAEIKKLREESLIDAADKSQKELLIIKFKYDKLREMAKGDKKFLDELNELQAAEEANYQAEQLQKANEAYAVRIQKEKENAEKLAEAKRSALEAVDMFVQNEEQRELAALDNRFLKLIAQTEEAQLTAEQTLPLWEAYWASREALEASFYERSQKKADEARLKELHQTQELTNNIGDIFSGLLEMSASNEVEYAEFKKIATLVQIATDTASGISSAIASGAKVGITPFEKAIAITGGIAVVLTNMVKAKNAIKQADKLQKPNIERVPRRATGGPTDIVSLYTNNTSRPQGYVRQATMFSGLSNRSYIAGEAGQEYIFSNAMLQNPIMANFAALSETLRTSGYDFTKRPDLAPKPQSESSELLELRGLVGVLIAETRRSTAAVEAFAAKPWSVSKLEETTELRDHIKKQASA